MGNDRRATLLGFLLVLLAGYSTVPTALGAVPPTIPTVVEMQVGVFDITAVDSSREQFTANVGIWARWHDPDLAGTVPEPTEFPLEEVWHPELQFINQQKVFQTFDPAVTVYPDGSVEHRQRLWGDFTQALNLRDFPLDVQTLQITVVAAGYSPEDIKFVESKERESGVAENLTLSDWQLLGHVFEVEPFFAFEGVRPIASFAFKVDVRRFRGYYVLKILVPLMLIIGMAYLVFWVSLSAASTRYSIAVTSMLTLIAYRFMVGGLLPKVSYMTRLDSFVMFSTVMVFLMLLTVVITGACEEETPERAARINKLARIGYPVVLVLIFLFSFRI